MAVGANALTTLANLREYLRIPAGDTGEDPFLEKLIDRATARLEGFADRKLKQRSLTEHYDGTGTPHLVIREFPIASVSEVNVDARRVFAASTQIALSAIVISQEEGRISLGPAATGFPMSVFPIGTKIVKVAYTAGLSPVPEDLELFCLKIAAMDFAKAREGADGVASESIGGRSISWRDGLPLEIREGMVRYRRAS